MKILKIESYPYELKFKGSFKTAKSNYEYRNGFIIKVFIDDLIGLGEVAPLSDFHDESLLECSYTLEAINQSISNIEDITSDELFDIFTLHSKGKSSLLFGLQTALLDILSQKSEVPLNKYLNNDCLDIINLNGVHTIHAPDKNFNIVKVKLGYNNIHDDIERMSKISSSYSSNIQFRIDVNGQLDLTKAIRFCKSMEQFNIEYIEQPLAPQKLEDLSELRMHTKIPIAVDESLTNVESAKQIINLQAADVFIIKPMMIGDYYEVNDIINLAHDNDVRCIITNMLDGAINRMACIHIASANNIHHACGLSMDNLFESDFYKTPEIINGQILVPKNEGLGLTND